MKVDDDLKLDFRDVLIRPRLGKLSSRKDVVLERTFQFSHSSATWTVFPLVASNMDATGTIRMARALSKHGAITALSKYYSTHELVPFFRSAASTNAFFSVGITSSDLERLQAVKAKTSISKISVEVANGYIPDLPKFVSVLRRENFQRHHHGRQCLHPGGNTSSASGRCGHCAGGDRLRFGLHHPKGDRCRISSTRGDY